MRITIQDFVDNMVKVSAKKKQESENKEWSKDLSDQAMTEDEMVKQFEEGFAIFKEARIKDDNELVAKNELRKKVYQKRCKSINDLLSYFQQKEGEINKECKASIKEIDEK